MPTDIKSMLKMSLFTVYHLRLSFTFYLLDSSLSFSKHFHTNDPLSETDKTLAVPDTVYTTRKFAALLTTMEPTTTRGRLGRCFLCFVGEKWKQKS